MACYIGIGLQFRRDSDEYIDRMCLPVRFESQEEAQAYINQYPELYNKWGASFSYGDCPIDELFISNWKKWCKRNKYTGILAP